MAINYKSVAQAARHGMIVYRYIKGRPVLGKAIKAAQDAEEEEMVEQVHRRILNENGVIR